MPRSILRDIPLAPYTTLKVGGVAEYFTDVQSIEELEEALLWARKENLQITVIGGGSNLLVSDERLLGLTIHVVIRGMVFEEVGQEEVYAKVYAGESWDIFVAESTRRGLWGVENLSGIPGSVGAAPVQNINAYGVSAGDSIVSVTAYHVKTGEQVVFTHDDCMFGYRDSFFKGALGSQYLISDVLLRLKKAPLLQTEYRSSLQSIRTYLESRGITEPTSNHLRDAVLTARRKIGMLEGMYQSAGSFFKNTIVHRNDFLRILEVVEQKYAEKHRALSPWYWELEEDTVKVSTAFLMECTPYNKTDFKGQIFNGTVGISPLHSLSIVNLGNATASDIHTFIQIISDAIEKEFGVRIESEVCFL